jgi:hypothetical protein
MTVGKPDFNLNSFGIKYLTKDEVQEFLEKYEIPHGKDQTALATERDKKGTGFKTSESANALQTPVTPKVAEKPAVATNQTISAPNAAGDKKLEGGTRSHFNSETYGYEGHQIKPLHGTGDKDKYGNRPKITEKPSVTKKPDEGENPPVSYKNERTGGTTTGSPHIEGKNPTGHTGYGIQTGNKKKTPEKIEHDATEALGRKRKEPNRKGQESPTKGISIPSGHADAPKDVKGEETSDPYGKERGKKYRVGVGVKAHEKLQENPIGEKRYAPDKKSPHSKEKETASKKEAAKRKKLGAAEGRVLEMKRQKLIDEGGVKGKKDEGYDKKDGDTTHDDEVTGGEKRKQPNTISSRYGTNTRVEGKGRQMEGSYDAGDKDHPNVGDTEENRGAKIFQKRQAGYEKRYGKKKANDIIMDMNIMKLDLMKVESSTPHAQFGSDLPTGRPSEGEPVKHENFAYVGRRGKRYKTEAELNAAEKPPKARNLLEERKRRETKRLEQEKYDKDTRATIGEKLQMVTHSASETVFKAISLKLDLTTLK